MSRPSILMLYTGGTIGMMPSANGLVPGPDFAEHAADWLQAKGLPYDVSIRALQPLIDSADATPDHWMSVARSIVDAHKNFDGFVVLHGTDTMAYTASALSFLLRGLAKPVVLTGSQIPFFAEGSDAQDNLKGALTFAAESRVREVCIYFDGVLLRGNRSVKFSTEVGEAFGSPHWPRLAVSKSAPRLNENALLKPCTWHPALPPVNRPTPCVGLIKVFPGLSARMLRATADVHPDGIVIELYGSGTASSVDPLLRQTLEALTHRSVPIVGVSQCVRGSVARLSYASSYLLKEAGVIPGHDLTAEAALTKLTFLRQHGATFAELPAVMIADLAGEITVMPG
jgi:L-asparaginase